MPGGRPTEYTEELLEKARHYLHGYEEYGDTVPTVAGLSLVLDMHRSTMYDWDGQEGKEEFSDILRKLKATQENALVSRGLDGKFNSTITKLILTKHGYSDKVETDITTKGESIGGTLTPEQADTFSKWADDVKKLEGLEE